MHPLNTQVLLLISTLKALQYIKKINFHPLKLCLATAIHNFKRVKITRIWLIWYQFWFLKAPFNANNSDLIG